MITAFEAKGWFNPVVNGTRSRTVTITVFTVNMYHKPFGIGGCDGFNCGALGEWGEGSKNVHTSNRLIISWIVVETKLH